jgi:signal transduction histidine kinase
VIMMATATWYASNWIHQLLEEAQARNRVLQESERQLERKVAERTAELALVRDDALAANRAKSTFLANMSHEFRTPLNAIIGYGELLHEEAEERGEPTLRADLHRILVTARHLLGLVDDVLDLSRIEAGGIRVTAEPFAIEPLVAETATTVQPLMDRHQNRLAMELAADLGVMRSDPTKVRQVLVNLLTNAAKFTSQGTVRLRVRREPGSSSDWITISVADSGIGMTREQIERVFDAFTQADPSASGRHGGAGLGLAIVRRFCELLGGEVVARSEPGGGSEFRVRLPAELPATDPPPETA